MTPHYNLPWLLQKYDANEPLKYVFFWGHTPKHGETVDKACFSQWYESPFTVEGITYPGTEHWMMAHKALLFNDHEVYEKIIRTSKAAEAKKLGRQIRGFEEPIWNEHRFEIVKQGNIHKFGQHPALGEFLLNTGHRVLVEASPVDAIWGIGLPQDTPQIENPHTWRGLNLLGFALMATRDALRENG